jgi:hypothetical protein
MRIYIPTRGRVNDQVTLHSLRNCKRLLKDVVLVVDHAEGDNQIINGYQCAQVLACPKNANSIGKVRQFIVDQHDVKKYGPHVLMLDDDLRFFVRRQDDKTKFLPITDVGLETCIMTVDKMLKQYAHVGILAREGGNRITDPIKECTRLLRALAYDVNVLRKKQVRFDRIIIMEDFDVALQLLRLGYRNAALCSYVQDQGGSQAAGGCSLYRTLERQAEGARGLAKLHAPFVKLVQKTTKTAWGGGTRTDVIVQWKQAYETSTVGSI